MQSAHQRVYLIVEDNPSGHRMHYVALILEGALARGYLVHLALTEEAQRSEEAEKFLSSQNALNVVTVQDASVASISAVAEQIRANVVVVPSGDAMAFEIVKFGWRCRSELVILILREFAQPKKNERGVATRSLMKKVLINIVSWKRRVRVVVLKPANWRGGNQQRIAIDPVELNEALKEHEIIEKFGLDRGIYWFAILGAITSRKNVGLTLEALGKLGNSYGLVVAGKIDQHVRQEIDQFLHFTSHNNIRVVNRLLEDAELDGLVRATDCLVLAHTNEGPSGLFGKALAAGTRILAAGATSLRADCLASPENATWVTLDVASLSRGMHESSQRPSPTPALGLGKEQFIRALL